MILELGAGRLGTDHPFHPTICQAFAMKALCRKRNTEVAGRI
jgi:hypothetical protein